MGGGNVRVDATQLRPPDRLFPVAARRGGRDRAADLDISRPRIAPTSLSRILKDHPHMAESRVESYRMWGEHVWLIMDCRDRRAARGIAHSGGLIRSRGGGSGTRDIAVAGGVDQLESGGFCEVARHRRGAEG